MDTRHHELRCKLRTDIATLRATGMDLDIELWAHPSDKMRQLAVDMAVELHEDTDMEPLAPQLQIVADY